MSVQIRNICAYRFFFAFIIALALMLIANYPGRLGYDSAAMILQGNHRFLLDNWQSPTIALMYSALSPPIPQPVAALLVQSLLLAPLPAAMMVDRGPVRAIGAIILLMLVPIAGFIVRDIVQLGAFLTCFAALIYLRGGWRVAVVIAMIALYMATRPSNFVTIALVGVSVPLLVEQSKRSVLASALIVAISVASVPAVGWVDQHIWRARDVRPYQSLVIYDLAGISARTGANQFTKVTGFDTQSVLPPESCYQVQRWDSFGWGRCQDYRFALAALAERNGNSAILKGWLEAIITEPAAYLKHRSAVFMQLLLDSRAFIGPTPWGQNSGEGLHDYDPVSGRDRMSPVLPWVNWSVPTAFAYLGVKVFRAWAALASIFATVVLLAFELRPARRRPIVLATLLVGIMNLVMLFGFTVADERRYLLPTLFAPLVAIGAMAAQGYAVRNEQIRPVLRK